MYRGFETVKSPENIGEKPSVILYTYIVNVVVVVVVDSHIQRIVPAAEETAVTQQVSYRPIKCQSRLWSQRGTKATGHIMVTTRYSDQ